MEISRRRIARWASTRSSKPKLSHLVVVATGRVHNQAGVLLHNHARRRVQAGHDFEMVLADEAAVAGKELRFAFERVSQRILAEQLCDLDGSIGLSISRLIITKFKLLQSITDAGGNQNLSRQTAPEYLHPTRPLTLAAYASVNARPAHTPEVMPPEASESVAGDNAVSMAQQGFRPPGRTLIAEPAAWQVQLLDGRSRNWSPRPRRLAVD